MHLQILLDQLENIKIGKALQLKLIKAKFVLHKLCLRRGRQQQLKERNQSYLLPFRPTEDIKDEVSITSGHDYKSSTVTASSGKRKYSFFSQKSFAWLLDDQEEKKFIKLMKKATDIIVKARTANGAETTDHYSMMGFTKAYNTAKKTCG